METTLQSPTSNEKKSLTSRKNTSHRGNDAHCPTFPSRQTVVQAKLELTTPGDSYEKEADRMADHVMRSAFSVSDGDGQSPRQTVSRPIVSRRSSGSGGVAVDSQTESGIMSSRGGGSSLPTALRSRMETGFGADFSNVRIHNDSTAAFLSNSIQAKAFTYGNDIYFNRGQYSPSSSDGQRLIAHELTHTLQQTGKVRRNADHVKGRQWGKEKETFNDLSFKDIFNFPTTSPYLLRVINFARFVSKGKNGNGDQNGYIIPDNVLPSDNIHFYFNDNFTGKHLIYFYNKYVQNNSTNSSISRSDYLLFFDYVDLVSNGIEDTSELHRKMVDKAVSNLASNKERQRGRGITIAIIADREIDQTHNSFRNYAYNDKDSPESDVYDNSRFFILQGLNSLDSYKTKINLLVELYGPLQNLIISGHGNWDRIILGNNLKLVTSSWKERFNESNKSSNERGDTINFFKFIRDKMNEGKEVLKKETGQPKQSIFLQACLTNSNIYTLDNLEFGKNFMQTLKSEVGNDIEVIANSASSGYQDVDYDEESGILTVTDSKDPTILKEHEDYTGKEYFYSRSYLIGNHWVDNVDDETKINGFKDGELSGFISELQGGSDKFFSANQNLLVELYNNVKEFLESWDKNYNKNSEKLILKFAGMNNFEVENDFSLLSVYVREIFYNANMLCVSPINNNNNNNWKDVFNQARNNVIYIINPNGGDKAISRL